MQQSKENDCVTSPLTKMATQYYSENSLVIKGPGAGAEVTAAKVLEGIVRVGLENTSY